MSYRVSAKPPDKKEVSSMKMVGATTCLFAGLTFFHSMHDIIDNCSQGWAAVNGALALLSVLGFVGGMAAIDEEH